MLLSSSTVEAHAHMAGHGQHDLPQTASPVTAVIATAIHTVGYLAVTGLVAWAFYRRLGLVLLRKTWFNFNLVWATALVADSACSRYSHNYFQVLPGSRSYSEVEEATSALPTNHEVPGTARL